MPAPARLVGKKFGRLTVIDIACHKNGRRYWTCVCDCGCSTTVSSGDLQNGHVKSCGCYQKEMTSVANTKHGATVVNTRLYRIWKLMFQRCYNANATAYKNYGGRGITVCDEWRDYTVFELWANAHGYDDSLSIDRVNNDGGYSPDNCRWTTTIEQARNQRARKSNYFGGERVRLKTISEEHGISYAALCKRLQHGWSIEDAIAKPVRHCRKDHTA